MVCSTFSSNPSFMDDPTLSHPFVNVRRTHDGPNPGDFCLNPPFFHTFHIALHWLNILGYNAPLAIFEYEEVSIITHFHALDGARDALSIYTSICPNYMTETFLHWGSVSLKRITVMLTPFPFFRSHDAYPNTCLAMSIPDGIRLAFFHSVLYSIFQR